MHTYDLQHQQNLSALERPIASNDSYRLQMQIRLSKEKEKLSSEFNSRVDLVMKESRLQSEQSQASMKVLNQIANQRQVVKEMRSQVFETEDAIALAVKERCAAVVKATNLKAQAQAQESQTEAALSRELEAKKAELQQIRADTQKALQLNVQRDTSLSVQQTISDLREVATKVVSRPVTA